MIDAAFDAAVKAALQNDAPLAEAMGGDLRLFELSAANGSPFPHVIYGDVQIVPVAGGCGAAFEIYTTLRVWTREDETGPAATLAQAKSIGGRVREVLDAPLSIDGHEVIDHGSSANYSSDADGLSALGVIEIRYWVEASA